MIIRRKFLQQMLGSLVATAVVPAALRAETREQRQKRRAAAEIPAATPSNTPDQVSEPLTNKNETARLRLWKTSDAPDQSIQIHLLPQGTPGSTILSPLKVEADNYQFSDYVEIPAGPIVAEISSSERATVHLPLHLAAGGQSTLLVRLKGPSLSAEWIDDTLNPVDSDYEFCAYNLLFASGDIQVDLGSVLSVHLSSTRSSVRLNGLKRVLYPITINGTDESGKGFHWNAEADFRQCRKATLLVYPDAYGRIRPRVSTI